MRDNRTRKNGANWCAGLATLCLLAGCAGGGSNLQRADADDLYDGQPRAVYGTELPAGSSAEAATRGDEAARRGDLDRALYFYIEAVNLDPHDVVSLLKIGGIHTHRRNQPLALATYGRVLEQEPDNAAALEGAGLALFRSRRFDEAHPMLAQAVAREPRRWQAHDALGIIADLNGEHPAALAHFDQALGTHPNSARLYNNRGYSRYLDGDLDGAAEDFQRAVQADGGFERAWRNLALVRSRQGRHQDALDTLLRVADEASAMNDVGYLAMLNGYHREAEHFLNEAISRSPTYYRTAHDNLRRLNEQRIGGR